MSDIAALSTASLGRLLSPVGQTGAAAGAAGQTSQEQVNEQAETRDNQALSVGTDGGSTPTGGRGQFVDVFA